MQNTDSFEYSYYSDSLKECYDKFGDVLDLPIISNPYTEILENYHSGDVLDLGAGKALVLYSALKSKLKEGRYFSLDDDTQGIFDYNNITEVEKEKKFRLIVANQFFEHLDIEASIYIFKKASFHLADKGRFIITIPNTSHPNRQISNITHITPWGFNNSYLLYKYSGLNVLKIARYSKRHPRSIIEKFLTRYISRVYRMDWCDSIILIGQKDNSIT